MIRAKRMEKNWSQAGAAEGICAVSYLSKIEQGKAQGSFDVIRSLLDRLEVSWHDDPGFLKETDKLFRIWYEKIFAVEPIALEEVMRGRQERLNSIYAPDQMLVEAWVDKTECYPLPSALEICLDERRLALQRCLQHREEEAVRTYPCALTALMAGEALWGLGQRYAKALDLFKEAYRLACEDGDIRLMLRAKLMIGNWYSNIHSVPEMEENYRTAMKIATALQEEDICQLIAYNTGATYFEVGRYEDAYDMLKQSDQEDAMTCQKMALCCEKLGLKEEALAAVQRARSLPAPEGMSDLFEEMCDLPAYRLTHSDYLHDKTYGEKLMHVFRECRQSCPIGFATFHLPWVLEWLTAGRMYKEAYELSIDFPVKCVYEGVKRDI